MNIKNIVTTTMRQVTFTFLTTVIILVISSCCTNKECDGFDNLNEIQLLNFDASDVDSLAFEIYESNSNFTLRIDSSFISAHGRTSGDPDLIIFMPESINRGHDYKITLFSNGEVYIVTNFETNKETCNTCFPYHPSSDYYNVLSSYNVNGQKQNSSLLTITK